MWIQAIASDIRRSLPLVVETTLQLRLSSHHRPWNFALQHVSLDKRINDNRWVQNRGYMDIYLFCVFHGSFFFFLPLIKVRYDIFTFCQFIVVLFDENNLFVHVGWTPTFCMKKAYGGTYSHFVDFWNDEAILNTCYTK